MTLNNTNGAEDIEIEILELARNLSLKEVLGIIKRLDEELTLSQNNHKDTTSDLEEANGKIEQLEEELERAKESIAESSSRIMELRHELTLSKNVTD